MSEGIVVLVFTRTDCPISNRYAPEVSRLHERFKSSHVRFQLVYVDSTQPVEIVRFHVREYAYPFQAIIDSKHELVRLAGVKITPEVAVFSAGRLVYRGRVDNRYVSAGKSRPDATVRDLEDTLTKLVQGHKLKFRSAPAVGCFIEDLR